MNSRRPFWEGMAVGSVLVVAIVGGWYSWRASAVNGGQGTVDPWLRKEFEALRDDLGRLNEEVHRTGLASSRHSSEDQPAPEPTPDPNLVSRLNSLERGISELGATLELRDELHENGSQLTSQHLSTAEVYVGAVGVLFTVIGFLFVLATYASYRETKEELKDSLDKGKTTLEEAGKALEDAQSALESAQKQRDEVDQKVNRATHMSEKQFLMLQEIIAALERERIIDEPTSAALRLDVEVLEKRAQLLHPDLDRVKDALQFFAYKYVEDAKVELDEVMKRVAHDEELRRLVILALSPPPGQADAKPPTPSASDTEPDPDPKDGPGPRDKK